MIIDDQGKWVVQLALRDLIRASRVRERDWPIKSGTLRAAESMFSQVAGEPLPFLPYELDGDKEEQPSVAPKKVCLTCVHCGFGSTCRFNPPVAGERGEAVWPLVRAASHWCEKYEAGRNEYNTNAVTS